MRASKKWFDNGSRGERTTEVTFSASATVMNNGEIYQADITLSRANQNENRAGMHETERLRILMDLPECRRLVAALQFQIDQLEYYARNAAWPPLNRK